MAKTLSTSGINSGQLIKTTQLTQVINSLTGADDYDITITGSLTISGSTNLYGTTSGSFIGDGSGLTGVTGEWDGTHSGSAEITGSLVVTQNITGSNISSSGNIIGLSGSFSELSGASPLTINSPTTFTQPIYGTTITPSSLLEATNPNVAIRSHGEIEIYNNQFIKGRVIAGAARGLIGMSNLDVVAVGNGVTPILLSGIVTASSDVSSSGTVIGNVGTFTTLTNVNTAHITASANISASGTISMLTASIGGGIFTSASLTSSPLQVNDVAESVVVTGVNKINFPNSTVFEEAPGDVSITFISSSYALTASHALNAGSDPFPYTGDAVITGSLIVSGSTLGGGSEIVASVLSLNDGTFGASGTSRGIKINSKDFAWGAPNSKLANVSIGSSAGNSLDQGGKNVLIGNKAGYYLVDGYWNVYIGTDTGNSNLSFEGNILIGNESGYYGGVSNQNNVAIGNTAMKGSGLSTNSSSFNVVLGYYAGTQIHNGNNNTILGYKSGEDIISGEGNIIIGNYAAKGSGDMDNQLVIGSGSLATISASLTTGDIIFQNTTVTNLTASSNISASGDIYGTTGSFGSMVLTAPNGTKYLFSVNNSGHLQLTGSVVP